MIRLLLVGWAKIACGNAASGLFRLLAFAIAAWSLEVTALGVIALIEAYVRVVDGLLNFQSVNVMTKFLTEAEHKADHKRFAALVKAGLLVDGATAIATCLFALALLPMVGTLVGIPSTWTELAMLYCLVIATRVLGTPESVFRCFDRYWAIGLRETISGAIAVSCSLHAWWTQAGPETFLLIWMASEAIANVLFIAWSSVVLRQRGITNISGAKAAEAIRLSPGFWPMLWQTNLTFGIRVLSQQGDLLLAGAMLGPAAPGLLRAAKNIASLLSLLGRPLQQVASARIVRLWADGNTDVFLAYTRNICAAAGAAGIAMTAVFAVVGHVALELLFGPEFVEAHHVLAILMLAQAVYLAGVTLLPTMVAMELNAQFFNGIVLGTATYAMVLAIGVAPLGIIGIGLAHVAFNVVWAVYCWQKVIGRTRAVKSGRLLLAAEDGVQR